MRVLVTGASGNVGTALLRRLSIEGVQLSGVARRVPDPATAPVPAVRWHAIDIGAPHAVPQLRQAMEGADAVVHLAWKIQPSHDEGAMRATNTGGTRAVIDAAVAARVPHLVHLSSVGAYAPGPRGADGAKRSVDETWPTTGIATSAYSRHKVEAERMLDALEVDQPQLALTRVRPGLVLQGDAGAEIARYFLGPLVPVAALRALPALLRGRVPLPLPAELAVPVVHADDLADALWRALERTTTGPLNIAAADPLTPGDIARALGGSGARDLPLPLLRAVVAATWRTRLQPTDTGWVDLAAGAPLLETARARAELGWTPQVDAAPALADLLSGLVAGRGAGTPALAGRSAASGRMAR